MTFAKDDLIDALRLRYDYYSAPIMFERARERAGLPEKNELDAKDVRALRAALAQAGDRIDGVLARLDQLLESAPADKGGDKKADKVEAKPEKHEAKPEKTEAKADKSDKVKTEAKTDEAKADKPSDAPAGS